MIGPSALKIDCLLVSPPAWYPYQPYMALPALQGHLRAQGFSTRILDLNLEYLDAQLSRGALEATPKPLTSTTNASAVARGIDMRASREESVEAETRGAARG